MKKFSRGLGVQRRGEAKTEAGRVLLKRYTHLKLKEIGERLGGMKESAVRRMVTRFENEAEERKDYRAAIAELEKIPNVMP